MRSNSLNANGCLVSLLTTLLMLHTLADDSIFSNSQPQKNDFHLSSGISLGDPSAGPFGNVLRPDDSKISGNWATDEGVLQINSNPQTGNIKSPLLADQTIACLNRRSIPGKRDQREDTICKWPYPRTTTTPTPDAQQGALSNEKPQPGKPWPKLKEIKSDYEFWSQLFDADGVDAEINDKVCSYFGFFPVCYPYKIPPTPTLVGHVRIVEPCRFCK